MTAARLGLGYVRQKSSRSLQRSQKGGSVLLKGIRIPTIILGVALLVSAMALYPGERRTSAGGSVLVGDANCDGVVNPIDSTLILQLSAGLLGVLPCPENGDASGDGVTNALDSALVLQLSAGLLDSLAPPATSTETPTNTHTPLPPTSTPSPTAPNCTLLFAANSLEPDTFCGNVLQIETLAAIPGTTQYDPVEAPFGTIFAVVFMDVTNLGPEKAEVGSLGFRLRNDQDKRFIVGGLLWADATVTAQDHFGRSGVFTFIQPGVTQSMVFVFVVTSESSGLEVEPCPFRCDGNLLPAPP